MKALKKKLKKEKKTEIRKKKVSTHENPAFVLKQALSYSGREAFPAKVLC